MNNSLVLILFLLCIVFMVTTTTPLIGGETQPDNSIIDDTCTCVDCITEDEFQTGPRSFALRECNDDQSLVIGSINIAIEGGGNEGFSYYTVDSRNRVLALIGQNFEYEHTKSRLNIQNCSMESSFSRIDGRTYVLVRTSQKEPSKVSQNIKTKCGPKRANDYELTISEPNPKYYYGSKVRIDLIFLNNIYNTIDTFLNGVIRIQKAKTPQQWIMRNGQSKIDLLLLEEFTNGNDILLEFTPHTLFNEQKISNVPVRIPIIKKASKGDLLIHKKQTIYVGKEFKLYFNLYDSDNAPTPSIDIPLVSISSVDSKDNLYCQITNYVNGYGFVTCENIETTGEYTLALKYNGVVLSKISITVEENANVNDIIVLLLVVMVIISVLILCISLISFVFFYKKLRNNDVKNPIKSKVTREDDAEELDNL